MSPSYEFFEGKNGLVTARARLSNGTSVLLHSAHDPIAEARRLVAGYPDVSYAGVVACLGLGLGYHVREILNVVPRTTRVLVIESSDELRDRFWRKEKNIPRDRVLITNSELEMRTFIYSTRDNLRNGFVLVEHPASLRTDPEFYRRMRSRLRDCVSYLLVDVNTAKSLNRFVQENILLNLPYVVADPGVASLTGTFAGKPAVIVSAGPSLNKNIDLLARAKERSVIVCVGTALRAMLARGLHPDLVVTLDPTEGNYRLFAGIAPTEAFLCYEPQTHHKIPPLFTRRFTFNAFSPTLGVALAALYGPKGYVEPGGSVAIAAFGLVSLLGANPIVFIGQDLAYTGGYTHAKGTVYEGRKVQLNRPDANLMEVPAIGGGTVFTSRAMHTFLVRFEELFAEHKDRLIIDATEGGALKRGTVVMSFREAIERYFTEEFPVLPVIEECHRRHRPDPAVRERVRQELEKTAREYGDFIPKLEEILSLASRIQELNDLAENMDRKEAPPGLVRGTLQALKKKGEELNELIKEVNAQAKLVDLLSLLTFDVQLMPPLAEDAPLAEQLGRIKQVYSLYLEAAKTTRRQMEEAAAALRGS